MKKMFLCLLFVTAGFMTIKAQDVASKEETAVAAVVEKLRLAMISGNKADLESTLAKEVSYGHSGGNMQTRAEFVDAITTKKSDFKTIELSKQSITVQGQVAIVRHVLNADTNDGNVPGHVRLGVVLVFKKEKNDWKLIARRAFKVTE